MRAPSSCCPRSSTGQSAHVGVKGSVGPVGSEDLDLFFLRVPLSGWLGQGKPILAHTCTGLGSWCID